VLFVLAKKVFVPELNFSQADGPAGGGLRLAVLRVVVLRPVLLRLELVRVVWRLREALDSLREKLGICGLGSFGSFHFGIDNSGSFGIDSLGNEKPPSRSGGSASSVMLALTPPWGATVNGSTTRYGSSD
jgi:hypothetical protein